MALATTEHVCLCTDVKDTWFINSIMKVHVCLEILHMQTASRRLAVAAGGFTTLHGYLYRYISKNIDTIKIYQRIFI